MKFSLSNPDSGFEQILSFDLNYSKELRGWHAWEDSYVDDNKTIFHSYAEPILSDIEFDKNNNIYLSFLDRHSVQSGTRNYPAILNAHTTNEIAIVTGELLKACYQNGVYSVEGTNGCLTYNYSNSLSSYTTPPTTSYEFFNDNGIGGAYEASNGALAILKGSNQLLATVIEPHPEHIIGDERVYWNSQGVNTLNLKNGSIDNWYATSMTQGNGLSGKANGMGDIELITEVAPIEIGDRVWFDENANGIQDANETGIKDVNISLICNNDIFTATTDSNGTYLFSNNPNGISTASYIYNIEPLVENNINNCYILIPNIEGNSSQAILNGKELTIANQGEGTDKNINDSDGIEDNNSAKVVIKKLDIPTSGYNNHSFDIGFKPSLSSTPTTPAPTTPTTPSTPAPITPTTPSTPTPITPTTPSTPTPITPTTPTPITPTTPSTPAPTTPSTPAPTTPSTPTPITPTTPTTPTPITPTTPTTPTPITPTTPSTPAPTTPTTPSTPTPPVVVPPKHYTLGDRVWIDSNRDGIQDINETGANGIDVNLYANAICSGNSIANTTTTNSGFYQFTNLSAGEYCIEFSNIPNDYNISHAQITDINLTNNDNREDVGIYPTSVVLSATDDSSCGCSTYTSKSVSTLNLLSILILVLLTITSTSIFFKNEL